MDGGHRTASRAAVPRWTESKSLFPREVAQNRRGLRHTPKGHPSKGPRGAPSAGALIRPQATSTTNGRFHTRPGSLPSSRPACLRGREARAAPGHRASTGLPNSRSPCWRPRWSCLPSHREACKTNHCTCSPRSPRSVGPHPSYSPSPRPRPLTALPHSCQQPSTSGLQ